MRWQVIFRSIVSNWAGYAITVLVGFFLSPLVVRSLGNTGYGIWTLILSLAGYFGLLDLGIRSSVGRFVARHLALKDDLSTNRTASTAFAILATGGVLTLVVSAALSFGMFDLFRVEPEYREAARIALLIVGLNIACALPLGIFSAILSAMERFDIISGVSIAGELVRAALIVTVLKNDYGLIAVASVALFTTLAQYLAMLVFAKRLYKPLTISPRLVNRATIKELFGFGIYRFVAIVATQLIFYSGSLVIGMFIGVASITFYAIASSLINYARNIVSLVTDSLYPTATRLDARQDMEGLRSLVITGTRLALIVALPLSVGMIFLGRQFITLWMGADYASAASTVLTILVLAQFTSMPQYVLALALAAMAKHRVLAFFSLGEGVVNIILSIVLAQHFGLPGVAWGTVVPHWIVTGVVVPAYTLRVLGLGAGQYYLRGFLRPLLAAVPASIAAFGFSRWTGHLSWGLLVSEAAAVCLLFAITSYFVCLDRKHREVLKDRIWSFLGREPITHEA